MKLTPEFLANTSVYLNNKIKAKDVIIEVYFPDVVELDLETYNMVGINILNNKHVGDTIQLVGIDCLLTMNKGIKIILK